MRSRRTSELFLASPPVNSVFVCVRWRLRLHIQLPPVQPRPPLPARRRVLFVPCCFQRLDLPPAMAFCVLQMLTLKELSLSHFPEV